MMLQRTWSTSHGNVDELALVSLGFPLTIPVRVGNDARVCITTDIKAGDLQFAPRDFLRKKNSGLTCLQRSQNFFAPCSF